MCRSPRAIFCFIWICMVTQDKKVCLHMAASSKTIPRMSPPPSPLSPVPRKLPILPPDHLATQMQAPLKYLSGDVNELVMCPEEREAPKKRESDAAHTALPVQLQIPVRWQHPVYPVYLRLGELEMSRGWRVELAMPCYHPRELQEGPEQRESKELGE